MSTLRQTGLLLVLSLCSTFGLAQFDTRAPSGLENRALGNPSPLPLAQAFPFYVSETGPNQLRVTWTPAAGHYLYRHAFHFSLQAEAAGELQELPVTLPAASLKLTSSSARSRPTTTASVSTCCSPPLPPPARYCSFNIRAAPTGVSAIHHSGKASRCIPEADPVGR